MDQLDSKFEEPETVLDLSVYADAVTDNREKHKLTIGKAGIKRGSSSTEWGIYVVSGYLSTLEIEHTSDTVEYILRLY